MRALQPIVIVLYLIYYLAISQNAPVLLSSTITLVFSQTGSGGAENPNGENKTEPMIARTGGRFFMLNKLKKSGLNAPLQLDFFSRHPTKQK